jgi:hypothetical protein
MISHRTNYFCLFLVTLTTILTLFCSCSSNKSPENTAPIAAASQVLDSDGDTRSDDQEKFEGTDPFIADVPKPVITIDPKSKLEVVGEAGDKIDFRLLASKENFLKTMALGLAARHGAVSTSSTLPGELNYNWKSFPSKESLKASDRASLKLEVKNKKARFRLNLTIEVGLPDRKLFRSVTDPILSLYFRKKDGTKDLLKSIEFDRHIIAGVKESFQIHLDDLPMEARSAFLSEENFLIAEFTDFYIPQLKSSYRQLMAKTLEKTVPVVVSMPTKTTLYFASASGPKNFTGITKSIFSENIKIETNAVTKVGELENTLANYETLDEIKDYPSSGKWFVATNDINKHFLDYEFRSGDLIVLSYFTAKEILSAVEEQLFVSREDLSTKETKEKEEEVIFLGNISNRSKLEFEISLNSLFGERLETRNETIPVGTKQLGIYAHCGLEINFFYPITEADEVVFNTESEFPLSHMELDYAGYRIRLMDLIKKKGVKVKWEEKTLKIESSEIANYLLPAEEQGIDGGELNLVFKPQIVSTHEGVKLVSASGQEKMVCPSIAAQAAYVHKISYSELSIFREWLPHIKAKFNVPYSGERAYRQDFSFNINSLIENKY